MQRRRFIQVVATSLAGLSLGQLQAGPLKPLRWRGYTLGAEGQFTLYTDNRTEASSILEACFAEIQRLEKCFSLYDARSELSRLNRHGRLDDPSDDWLPLLAAADAAHRLTGGRFDPTIQPLWKLYAEHFAKHPDCSEGPEAQHIEAARAQTGWQQVHYNRSRIQFTQPGIQLSLNGIAQGFITDRVAQLLQAAGYQHALIELGESRALGSHPQGRPWQLGIKDAEDLSQIKEVVALNNQALATSGSYGSSFSTDGQFHHLIHPQTGKPASTWKSISVLAPTAAEADALSTGLSFATDAQIQAILSQRADLQLFRQG